MRTASDQVDLRSYDLSRLDVSNRLSDLQHADFDDRTRWPEKLPEGFNPANARVLGRRPWFGSEAAPSQGRDRQRRRSRHKERTTLVRNLGPLERDGLVKLSGKGRGGKVTVEITPKGKSALAKLMPDWRAAQQAAVKTLGEERWSAILSDLKRVAQALEE